MSAPTADCCSGCTWQISLRDRKPARLLAQQRGSLWELLGLRRMVHFYTAEIARLEAVFADWRRRSFR